MQDQTNPSTLLTRPNPSQITATIISFVLMGALSGVLTGVVDATSGGGPLVLLGAVGLHLLVGGLVGFFLGLGYGLFPEEYGVQLLIQKVSESFFPSSNTSYFHRGQVISGLWVIAFISSYILPEIAYLGIKVTQGIRTPIWSLLVTTSLISGSIILSVPLIRSLSLAGGRSLEKLMAQMHRLSSSLPASFHPVIFLGALYAIILGLTSVFPLLTQLIKDLNDPIWVILSTGGVSIVFVMILWGLARALSGAKYQGAISGILKLMNLSQSLIDPLLHLGLVVLYLLYIFSTWTFSQPEEWAILSIRPPVILTFFFIPLVIGGEYLKPFVKHSQRWVTIVLLLTLAVIGFMSSISGLNEASSRKILNEETTSSAFILQQLKQVLDRDGDGFVSALGDIDCDENNPQIYPGAKEIAGNEIDEDCDGLDLPPIRLKSIAINTNIAKGVKLIDPKQAASRVLTPTLTSPATSLFDRISGPYHMILITAPGFDLAETQYGGAVEVETPALNQLAESALVLDHAYATTSEEEVSLFSILTGRYPSEQVRDNKRPTTYSKASRTLAETLEQNNYRTAAFIVDPKVNRALNFNQGFQEWTAYSKKKERLGDAVRGALGHLENTRLNRREWHFLWLHTDELIKASQAPRRAKRAYQSAMEQFDEALQKLVSDIALRPDRNKFVIAVVGTRGVDWEGNAPKNLREESLLTSALLKIPKLRGRKLSDPASLIKITPTLLDLAEIETFDPNREMMRLSSDGMVGWALGDQIKSAPIYAESLHKKMNLTYRVFIEKGWKLYTDQKGRKSKLYWLKKHGESKSRHELEETRLQEMLKSLQKFKISSRRALPKLMR